MTTLQTEIGVTDTRMIVREINLDGTNKIGTFFKYDYSGRGTRTAESPPTADCPETRW